MSHCLWLAAPAAVATTYEITPLDDFETVANMLGPGDELVLGGGTYNLSGNVTLTAIGTFAAPIVIRAKTGEFPILIGDPSQNVLNIAGEWLEIRDLEITGGAGVGIDLEGTSDHITIEGCTIHGTASGGIWASDSGAEYTGLRIRDNEIYDTGLQATYGRGIYLGCTGDLCRVLDAVIEHNYIHHMPVAAQGIRIQEGSADVVLRDNVVHDTGVGCIELQSPVGNGAAHRVEGNALWGCGAEGILASDEVLIQNNLVFGAVDDAIRLFAWGGGTPTNVEILHNPARRVAGHPGLDRQ